MNELLEDYGSTKVEKDREMREFDDKMKELQVGFSDSEKQRILMEISSVAQELSRKMDEKEAKLRDDTVNKLTVIENTLVEENRHKAAREKELQEKVESQMKEAKLYGDAGNDSLKQHIDDTPKGLGTLKEDMDQIEEKLVKKIDQERKERMDDVKEIRSDIDRIIGKEEKNVAAVSSLARLNQDVDETQTGVKKLAEAVFVVRTTLAEKIKDEKKLREQESTILQRDVDRLNIKYNELREKIKTTSRTTAAAS